MSNIEFLENTHEYLVDGVLTPSVTRIVRSVLPGKYTNVPQKILQAKAEYGNQMHEWIERYLLAGEREMDSLSPLQRLSAESTLECLNAANLLPKEHLYESELNVAYYDLYAGKFDLVVHDEQSTMIDIKTTAEYDSEYLAWQLGLYKMAYEHTFGIELKKFYCLWVPKKKNTVLIEVEPIGWQQCLEAAMKYNESLKEDKPSWLLPRVNT